MNTQNAKEIAQNRSMAEKLGALARNTKTEFEGLVIACGVFRDREHYTLKNLETNESESYIDVDDIEIIGDGVRKLPY